MTLSPVSRSGNAPMTPPSKVAEIAGKVRVTVEQCRLLSKLWPYAFRYRNNFDRNQIISDIFDGWLTKEEVRPLVVGGLAIEERFYDPSDTPRHYQTWALTPMGERAVFGAHLQSQSREKQG